MARWMLCAVWGLGGVSSLAGCTDARSSGAHTEGESPLGSLAAALEPNATQVLDSLLTTAAWSVESNQKGLQLGKSVAGVGDVNGDGLGDVVVVSQTANYLYLGTRDGLATTTAWMADGSATRPRGTLVAGACDVNGDGYSDVIVADYVYSNGQDEEGRVAAYLGSSSGLGTTSAWSIESDALYGFLGISVACAGDVNGDGYSDVLVGSGSALHSELYLGSASGLASNPAWNSGFVGDIVAGVGDLNGDGYSDVSVFSDGTGEVSVYMGSASGLPATAAWDNNVSPGFQSPLVAGAGDVNGDGYDDLLLSWPTSSAPSSAQGIVYLLLGSASGLPANASWTEVNPYGFNGFGTAVAPAGDVNGDGYADVLIGSAGDAYGQADLYLGSATGLQAAASWTRQGATNDDLFGYALASAGDVNGDGFADVVVGSPGYANGQKGEGRADVYHGRGTVLGGVATRTYTGSAGNSTVGNSVASAGDVNGDGYADVIVGAYRFSNPESAEGRATVYLGTSSGVAASPVWTGEPNVAASVFGSSVASAGDVNGDGYSDVIVGASQYTNGESKEGSAYVYLGKDSGVEAAPAWTVESDQADARLGASVASAGDVNGDGYSDVIVGAYAYDRGEGDEGRAWVYLGSATGLSTTPAWSAEGDEAGANFGFSVAGAGDVNGDGFSDVVVGANLFSGGEASEGRVLVYLGSPTGLNAAPAFSVESNTAGLRLGYSVASAGDVNGDGFSDIIVGGYTATAGVGQDFVYLGSASGLAVTAAWRVSGARVVASAGDVNGDGFSDVVTGYTTAQVYLGSARGLATTPAYIAKDSGGNVIPGVVASAGDVNGDGFSDLIVGDEGYDLVGATNTGHALVFLGNGADGTTALLRPLVQARRAATTTPIAPLGIAPGAAFDVRAVGRSPFGRSGMKLAVEVKPRGAAFDGTGLVTSSAWTDSGLTGASLTQAVTDLASATEYHVRARFEYPPQLGFAQLHSRWVYAGILGEPLAVHLRTACASGSTDTDGDGISDCLDGCDDDPSKTAPGACGCGIANTDSDGDATPDCSDGCDSDAAKLAPGQCGCSVPDTDDDSDGTANCNDACPADNLKVAVGVCGCGTSDVDGDGDGTPNCDDGCPSDPGKVAAGVCGCGTPDTDNDSDGTPNCDDGCTGDPSKVMPGVCGCGASDADSDGDGTPNCLDDCPSDPAKLVPGSCGCGVTEGVCVDGCPSDPTKVTPGACGCGTPDTDTDFDGAADCNDVCQSDPGKSAPGICGCGQSDADSDSDGTANCSDDCPAEPAATSDGCPIAGNSGEGGAGGGPQTGGGGDSGGGGGGDANGPSGSQTGGDGGRSGSDTSSGGDDMIAVNEGGESGRGVSTGTGGVADEPAAPASGGGADSGCGCRVAGPAGSRDGALTTLLLAIGWVARRRRARHASAAAPGLARASLEGVVAKGVTPSR